jgi:Thioesterase-like superfamily
VTEADDAPVALFLPDGDHLVPTQAAIGPWSATALHGSATASLLAGYLEQEDSTLARVQIELLAPAPRVPLLLRLEPRTGQGRVTRQTVRLFAGADEIARATGLSVLRADFELPAQPATLPVPPAPPSATPENDAAGLAQRDSVGWPWFGSLGVVTRAPEQWQPEHDGVARWTALVLPVVAGTAITGVQRAVGAADFGAISIGTRLPFGDWKFPNADIGVHLSREPSGPWILLSSRVLLQAVGIGLTSMVLYDSAGHLGQANQTLVLGRRRPD